LYQLTTTRKSDRPPSAYTQQPAWNCRPTRTPDRVTSERTPPVAEDPFGVTWMVPVDSGSGCGTSVTYAIVLFTAVKPAASVSTRPFGVTVLPGASKTTASP